jgi:hypothetical protein
MFISIFKNILLFKSKILDKFKNIYKNVYQLKLNLILKHLFLIIFNLSVFIFFPLSFAKAASPSIGVQATVDRNEMGLGDSLQLTISVSSTENVDVGEPKVPQLKGFNLLNSGSSTSTSTKLVQGANGMQFQTLKRYDFIYLLGAQQKGNLTIPAFEVLVEGRNYLTKPIVIKVSPEGSGATLNPRNRNQMDAPDEELLDEADQIMQQMLRNRGMNAPPDAQFKSAPKNQNEAFFVQVELDKKEV